MLASDDGWYENLYSQDQTFIPIRAAGGGAAERLSGSQAAVNYQQRRRVVRRQFTRSSSSGKSGHLCFSAGRLYSAHSGIITAEHLLTPVCQTANIHQSSEFIGSTEPSKTPELFLFFSFKSIKIQPRVSHLLLIIQ